MIYMPQKRAGRASVFSASPALVTAPYPYEEQRMSSDYLPARITTRNPEICNFRHSEGPPNDPLFPATA